MPFKPRLAHLSLWPLCQRMCLSLGQRIAQTRALDATLDVAEPHLLQELSSFALDLCAASPHLVLPRSWNPFYLHIAVSPLLW